jgi:16S rRNA (adenine1518-N6/adenine1519-N6)-dimethyltransferase
MTAPIGTRPPTGTRPPRLDADTVRRTLKEAGLHARHALSQNFLADIDVLDAILAEAAPTPGRRVLEIGPGLGILTGGLLAAGAAVTTVELDRALAARLRSAFVDEIAHAEAAADAPGGLRLIEGDALDQPLTTLLAAPYDVVANLPYHVTSPILHRLLEGPPRRVR